MVNFYRGKKKNSYLLTFTKFQNSHFVELRIICNIEKKKFLCL